MVVIPEVPYIIVPVELEFIYIPEFVPVMFVVKPVTFVICNETVAAVDKFVTILLLVTLISIVRTLELVDDHIPQYIV